MDVQWRKTEPGFVLIHEYSDEGTQDLPGEGYQSQTELFPQEFSSGNVSLKLKRLQVVDAGTYQCLVRNPEWTQEATTELRVAAVAPVFIDVLGPRGQGIGLVCRSTGWFPKPELQWVGKNWQNLAMEIVTNVTQDRENLYRVVSHVAVTEGEDNGDISCIVQNGLLQTERQSAIHLSACQELRERLDFRRARSYMGTLRVPTLYLSQTSARPGDSVLLRCSVFSRAPATRVIFCKDGEEVSSQRGLLRKVTYDYDHVVSGGSTGNYACGYEIKGRDNQVIKSQLSRAQHLSITVTSPPCAQPGAFTFSLPHVTCGALSFSHCASFLVRLAGLPGSQAQTSLCLYFYYKCPTQSFLLLCPPNLPTPGDICDNRASKCPLVVGSADEGILRPPTLYLSQTSARQGDSVLLQCSVFSQLLATRIVFCKDGEEVSSQRGLEEKITYDYVHVVSMGSSGNYSCGYEIKDSDNRVNGSQLSPAQHLSITSKGDEQQSESNSPCNGRERIQMQKAE
ncbi:Butyrophilin-like protein 1 [Chelonia mydas]|uniref:Butyrophilin-like protein 1 n=1 Tax=Chelonia mydas TaxID=8469 RepID=M7AVB1_CHEMY|nr:Butyrophilin-like protein 1 [Chelonia mydas]